MLEHLDLEGVLTRDQEGRQIEFGRQTAVLGVADFLPVDTEIHRRAHAAEMDDRSTVLPVLRDSERARVESDRRTVLERRIVLRRFNRRITDLFTRNRIGDVRIQRRIVVALKLPAARDSDRARLRPVFADVALPLEVPGAVQRLKPLGLRTCLLAFRNGQRELGALARHSDGTGRQTVDRTDSRVAPRVLGGIREKPHCRQRDTRAQKFLHRLLL